MHCVFANKFLQLNVASFVTYPALYLYTHFLSHSPEKTAKLAKADWNFWAENIKPGPILYLSYTRKLKPIVASGSQFYDLSTINREVATELCLLSYLFYDISCWSLTLQNAINVIEPPLYARYCPHCRSEGTDEYRKL